LSRRFSLILSYIIRAALAGRHKASDLFTAHFPGSGYFQSCSNGFRGCCKGDACGSTGCPDVKPALKRTPEPVAAPAPTSDSTICAAGTGYFQACANGFRVCCKSDACGSAWWVDYKPSTYEPVGAASAPAPVAPAAQL